MTTSRPLAALATVCLSACLLPAGILPPNDDEQQNEQDTEAPQVTLTAPAASSFTLGASVPFAGTATDNVGVASVEVRVGTDGQDTSASFNAPSWSIDVPTTGLAAGTYLIMVRALDAAGNVGVVTKSITLEDAPVAVLGGAPAALTNVTSLTVTVAGANVAQYRYRLDGAAFSADTPVATPIAASNLSEGMHTLEVHGGSASGVFQATPTTVTWTIDTTPPLATLAPLPSDPTNQTSYSFTIGGDGVVAYKAAFDGGALSAAVPVSTALAQTLTSETLHSMSVVGIDAAGNEQAAATTLSWTIDTTPPTVTLQNLPPALSNDPTPSITLASGQGVALYNWTITCDAVVAASATSVLATTALTPTSLPDGTCTLSVTGFDAAGNSDTAPDHVWVIDASAPDTTLTGLPNDPTNASSVDVAVSGGDCYRYSLSCSAGPIATNMLVASTTTHIQHASLPEGSCTLSAAACDDAGNADATAASFTWTIDLTRPTASLSGVPGPTSPNTAFDISVASSDGATTYRYSLDCDDAAEDVTDQVNPLATHILPAAAPVSDGACSLQVFARDAAGNEALPAATASWVVDTTAPDTQLSNLPADPTNTPPISVGVAGPTGAVAYRYSLDCAGTSADVTDAVQAIGTPITATTPDGACTLTVLARDQAGNEDASAAIFTWTVDTSAVDTLFASGAPANPTNQNDLLVGITGTTGISSYTYALDCDDDAADVALTVVPSYTTPITKADIGDGQCSLTVTAIDTVGNPDPSPLVHTWRIDTAAPVTAITTGVPASPTLATSISVGVTGPTDGVRYEYSLDCASPFSDVSGQAVTNIAVPIAATGIPDGACTLTAAACDAAGNCDGTAEVVSWVVNHPATISADPQSITVNEGATPPVFAVSASGSGALSYAWFFESAAITGATGPTYAPASVTPAIEGDFHVVVTNTVSGTTADATSAPATLTVHSPAAVSGPTGQTVNAGANASFTVSATPDSGATITGYQWFRGATPLANTPPYSGATTATLQIASAANADEHADYHAQVTSTLNGVDNVATSASAALVVHGAAAISGPSSMTAAVGASALLSVAATADAPATITSYQWRRGTTPLADGPTIIGAATSVLQILNLTLAEAGSDYNVVVTTSLAGTLDVDTPSSNAALTVHSAPTITDDPDSQNLVEGASATLGVTATTGSVGAVLSYQWQKGGSDLPGETGASLALTNVQPSDEGSYRVIVTSTLNGHEIDVTSAAAVVNVNAAPLITAQPQRQTRLENGTAVFSVTVTAPSSGTLSYQWRRGVTNVGTSSPTLTVTPLSVTDVGDYSVIVTRTVGATTTQTTSAAAPLTLVTNLPASPSGLDSLLTGVDVLTSAASYRYTLDCAAPFADHTVASQTGVITASNIPDGECTLTVRANDGSNAPDALFDVFTWSVDADAPIVTCARDRTAIRGADPIVFHFDQPVTRAATQASVGGALAATPLAFAWSNGDRTLTITPDSTTWLPAATTYDATITLQATSATSGPSAMKTCAHDRIGDGATILYVDAAATGLQDGSLGNPFATISQAVTAATDGTAIFVSEGTYTPSSPILLQGSLARFIYGGFRSPDFAQRDTTTYVSTIQYTAPSASGLGTAGLDGAFTCPDASSGVVDGFEITSGAAGSDVNAALSVTGQCPTRFRRNTLTSLALTRYVGVYVYGGSVTATSARFTHNTIDARLAGEHWGVYVTQNAEPIIEDNTVTAGAGGTAVHPLIVTGVTSAGPVVQRNVLNVETAASVIGASVSRAQTFAENRIALTNVGNGTGFTSNYSSAVSPVNNVITLTGTGTLRGIFEALDPIDNAVGITGSTTCDGILQAGGTVEGNSVTVSCPSGTAISLGGTLEVTSISDNTLRAANGIVGSALSFSAPLTIDNNAVRAENTLSPALSLTLAATNAQPVTITNNTLTSESSTTLYFDSSRDPGFGCGTYVFSGNRVGSIGGDTARIAAKDCVDVYNNVFFSLGVALRLEHSDVTPTVGLNDALVEHNTMLTRSAAVITGANTAVTLRNNIFAGDGALVSVGVNAVAAAPVELKNNVFTRFTQQYTQASAASGCFGSTHCTLDPVAAFVDDTTYGTVADHADLDAYPLTVEAWIFPTDVSGNHGIVSKGNGGGTIKYSLFIQGGKYRFHVYDDIDQVTGAGGTATANTWVHVAATFDATNPIRVFQDGVDVTDENSGTPAAIDATDPSTPLYIGLNAGTTWDFTGAMSEVRVSSAVKYTTGFTPASPLAADADTVALYHFDEGTGVSAANDGGTAGAAALTNVRWRTLLDLRDANAPTGSFDGNVGYPSNTELFVNPYGDGLLSTWGDNDLRPQNTPATCNVRQGAKVQTQATDLNGATRTATLSCSVSNGGDGFGMGAYEVD